MRTHEHEVVQFDGPVLELTTDSRTFPGDRPGATWVYERAGLPCRRCGTPVKAHGQGENNRTTFWCPGCQS